MHMPAEPQIPPEVIKELATAAIAKRKQETKKAAGGKLTRPLKISERNLLELTKSLSDFYGYAAVPRTNKEHRLMADLIAENWVPLMEYERQVQAKEEALERIEELQREINDLRARIEQRIKDVPRLKGVIRSALTRLVVDTSEKHVKEEWAVVLLKRMEAARDILRSEAAIDAKA
jgi:Asp-tRNA(Asn)/Glu-tRNA(Gln) amidotransferase B subunit